MLVAIIGVVGVLAGTVVGAVLTQRLQRRTAAEAHLHQERLTAYSAFATAMMEYRRGQTDRAFKRSRGDVAELGDELFPARSAAWSAYYRVRLLAGDETIIKAAEVARDVAGEQPKTIDEAERERLSRDCRVAVTKILDVARLDIKSP